MLSRLLVTIFHLAIGLMLLTATQGEAVEWLSWNQCLAEAKANNPQLKALKSEITKSELQITEAKAAFLPQINAKAEANRSQLYHPAVSSTEQYALSLTLNQSLFDGYRDRYTLAERQELLAAAQARSEQTVSQVAFELRMAYVSHLYAQRLIEVQNSTLARREENVRLVAMRYTGGRENKGALLKSQATVKLARVEANQAQRQLELARTQLAKALGRPQSSDTMVSGQLGVKGTVRPMNLEALTQSTPTLKEAQAALSASKFALSAAYAEHYPDLSAFASLSRSGSWWLPEQSRLAVGLVLTVPIYGGGAATARISGALANYEQKTYLVQSSNLEVRNTLQQSHADLLYTNEMSQAQEEVFAAAKVQAEIARNQYNLGLISFQDWNAIESELIDAERSLLQSLKGAALAQAAWAKAQGLGFNETF